MPKRYNQLPMSSASVKRPKIDIKTTGNGVTINMNTGLQSKTVIPIPKNSVWSDDDDENDLLLVHVSSQMEKKAKQEHTEIGFSETFTGFANGANVQTSTQMFVAHGNANQVPDTKWDDDDDDFLLSQFNIQDKLAQIEANKLKQKEKAANDPVPSTSKDMPPPSVPVFKVPEAATHESMDTSVILPSQMTVSDEARSKMQQRKQRAQDLRIAFLEKHIEKLEVEKKQIEESMSHVNQKYQARETDINSLKYQLQQAKSTLERMRQDKLKDTEKINKDWMERMNEVEKKLKLYEMELKKKDAEIISVKMRKSTNASNQSVSETKIKFSDVYNTCHQVVQLPNPPMIANPKIIKDSDQKYVLNKEICVKQFEQLTMAMCKVFVAPNDNNIMTQVLPTVKTVLKHIYRFTLTLNKTNPQEYQQCPLAELEHLADTVLQNRSLIHCDTHSQHPPTIYDADENVRGEKILVARRCLAIIAEMCRSKTFVAEILSHEMQFLRKLASIVRIIGCSDEYAEFSVILTAIITIITNVYMNAPKSNLHEKPLFELIKSVVHCRVMNIVTLHAISKLLQTITTQQDKQFIEHFCNKNCDMVQKSDLNAGIIRFTCDSCILQVLGACLETSVLYNHPLDATKVNLIAELVINIGQFLITSDDLQVSWLKQPPVGDNIPVCPCIPKLICGYILLFHTCLHAFINNPHIIDMKEMCYLTKQAVLLLARTFEQYEEYKIDIFTYGSGSKNDVIFCYKGSMFVLNKYQLEYGFDSCHVRALEILSSPKILMDYQYEYEETEGTAQNKNLDCLDDLKALCL